MYYYSNSNSNTVRTPGSRENEEGRVGKSECQSDATTTEYSKMHAGGLRFSQTTYPPALDSASAGDIPHAVSKEHSAVTG